MTSKKSFFITISACLVLLVTLFLIWESLIKVNRDQSNQPSDKIPASNEAANTLSPSAPATAGTQSGFPFGPYHLPPANYGSGVYTGAFLDLSKYSVTDATAVLDTAKSKNMKVLITLAGGGSKFKSVSGNYSSSSFQQAIDRYRSLDLNKYVQDETVLGILILDEPQDQNNWNGKTVTLTEIKQAAAYVKSIWPTLPVGVGSNPSFLKGGNWTAADLDFVSTPFTEKRLCTSARPGCYGANIGDWIKGVVADAKADNLGLMLSLNVLNGGRGGTNLSAGSLENYGKLLVGESYACGLIMWKWDPAYFDQQEIQLGLKNIADAAKNNSSLPCKP